MSDLPPPGARSSPSTARNRDPILEVMKTWLPKSGLVLEIAAGAGEHALHAAAADNLILFGGLNCQFFIEEYQRGARGQMPGSDLTRELVAIWNALQANNLSAAWDEFTRILPLLRFELQPGLGVSAMKHNLVSEGIIASARVRHPTASLDAASLAELIFLRQRIRPERPV